MGNKTLLTDKYAGIYSYGKDIEKGRIGVLSIYPETDSTVLFYIDLNRGAPSYNMGSLYERIKISNDSAAFNLAQDDSGQGCRWIMHFSKRKCMITTVDHAFNCGFGHAVYVDGVFKRKSTKIPLYFENQEGSKIYFSETNPEEYYIQK